MWFRLIVARSVSLSPRPWQACMCCELGCNLLQIENESFFDDRCCDSCNCGQMKAIETCHCVLCSHAYNDILIQNVTSAVVAHAGRVTETRKLIM